MASALLANNNDGIKVIILIFFLELVYPEYLMILSATDQIVFGCFDSSGGDALRLVHYVNVTIHRQLQEREVGHSQTARDCASKGWGFWCARGICWQLLKFAWDRLLNSHYCID